MGWKEYGEFGMWHGLQSDMDGEGASTCRQSHQSQGIDEAMNLWYTVLVRGQNSASCRVNTRLRPGGSYIPGKPFRAASDSGFFCV